jgi:hypothetical protein
VIPTRSQIADIASEGFGGTEKVCKSVASILASPWTDTAVKRQIFPLQILSSSESIW